MDLTTLYKISYGLYVVSSGKEGKFNGQIANTVFQVTSEPPTIAVSINKENLTHQFILESKVFTVSVLRQETPLEFIGHFGFKSGRIIDKFKGVNYKIGKNKIPIILDNTLAYLEAQVVKETDAGTHTIFIGKVVEAEIFNNEEPMTYAYYHQVKSGKAPKTAPTYIEEKPKEGKMTERLQVYKCEICGNIVEILHEGVGELVCCGQPMKLMEEKTEDEGKEKHVPVLEKTDKDVKVKVGSVPHPMEEKHYIEWIEVVTKDGIARKFLKPGRVPEAEFEVEGEIVQIREYCNLHGLWTKKEI